MASISKTVRPKRSNNSAVSPAGYGLTAGRGTPTATASGGGGGGTLVDDGYYFSTYEPVDANTLLADDFSRGAWYTKDYTNAMNSGGLGQVGVHGWGGTVYANPITPPGAVEGGGVGLHGRQYAATSGYQDGSIGSRNMADHGLLGAAQYTDIYFRYYVKPLAGYLFGQHKGLTVNRGQPGVGGIYFGTVFYGSSSPTSTVTPHFYPINQGVNLYQNQGTPLTMTGGNWYYVELHLQINGTGGSDVVEMWMDNCGASGLSGPATPTLRMRYTNATLRPGGDTTGGVGSFWIENWSNPGNTGTMYYANVYASRAFIGFANPTHQP